MDIERIDECNTHECKYDAGKPKLTMVPLQILEDIARVRTFATEHKYPDPDSWRHVSPERYRDAMFRHMRSYIEDPYGVDDESGLPHLYHLATNVAFLCELEHDNIIASLYTEEDAKITEAVYNNTCSTIYIDAFGSIAAAEKFMDDLSKSGIDNLGQIHDWAAKNELGITVSSNEVDISVLKLTDIYSMDIEKIDGYDIYRIRYTI